MIYNGFQTLSIRGRPRNFLFLEFELVITNLLRRDCHGRKEKK